MPRFDDFQDYLYVSKRKALRMGQTLRPETWRRIKKFGLNLGPAGATMSLDNAGPAGAIALLPELVRALDEQYGIRDLNDPDLHVGHWFLAEALEMAYGIHSPGTVLFAGRESGTKLLLGGAAEHLLDRRVHIHTAGSAAPASSDRFTLVTIAALEFGMLDPEGDNAPSKHPDPNHALATNRRFEGLIRTLAYGDPEAPDFHVPPDLEPLTAVARVLAVWDPPSEPDSRLVIGTPLYVAFHVPK